MFKSVFFLVPYLLLFPISFSFSTPTNRCSLAFKSKDSDLDHNLNLEKSQQSQSRKRIVLFKPWFEHLVRKFGGDEPLAKQYIIEQLVKYGVTKENYERIYNQHPEVFADWPRYETLIRNRVDIFNEYWKRLGKNPAVQLKRWFKKLVKEFWGDEQKAKHYIIDTLVKYGVRPNNYAEVYSQHPEVFEGWFSYPTIVKSFPEIRKEVTRQLSEKKHQTSRKEQKYVDFWYRKMLHKFNGDKDKADAYIIEMLLLYAVTSGNYAYVYKQHLKVFADWPSYSRLPHHIRQMMIDKRSKQQKGNKVVQDWFNELLDKFYGNKDKTLAYIVEIILKYKVTLINYRAIYDKHPGVFEKWPSPASIKRHYPEIQRKVIFIRYGKSPFIRVDIQAWYKDMLRLNGGSKNVAQQMIVSLFVKLNITNANKYTEIRNQHPEVFLGWPSYVSIIRLFPEVGDKVYEAKGKTKRHKPVVVQSWREEMLNRNGANVEATNTYIAKILVHFNINENNYREIYDQHLEIFDGWPSLHVLKHHYPQIIEKILEIREVAKKQEQSLHL